MWPAYAAPLAISVVLIVLAALGVRQYLRRRPTPEEIESMINSPRGKPIPEIIAELERELA